ncbi:mCG1036292, partial [Mus musculus]
EKEKKKDQSAEVSRRRSLYSSLDELKEPVLSSSESDEKAIRAWKVLSRAGEATGQNDRGRLLQPTRSYCPP